MKLRILVCALFLLVMLPARSLASGPSSSSAMYIQNVGQFDQRVLFQAQADGLACWLMEDALWMRVPAQGADGTPAEHYVDLRLTFVGANPSPRFQPFGRLRTKVSYFKGSDPDGWRPDVPVWSGVRLVDLYPGIDLELSSASGALSRRIVARRGADVGQVRMSVEGADELVVTRDGVRGATAVGIVEVPLLELDADGLLFPRLLGFWRPRVIKLEVVSPFASPSDPPGLRSATTPEVLYGTYFGALNADTGEDVALGPDGSVYIVGNTLEPGVPVVPGAFMVVHGGHFDAFVARFSTDGRSLLACTFVGGSNREDAHAIAVDRRGEAAIVGYTNSANFPTHEDGFDRTLGGDQDGFYFRLSADGTQLEGATYIGREEDEAAIDVALDGDGSPVITGYTESDTFPVTEGAYDLRYNGGGDAFVLELDRTGESLHFSTFLGGTDRESGESLALSQDGQILITGGTSSADFPTSAGAFDRTLNGDSSAYVSRLDASGSRLVHSTR